MLEWLKTASATFAGGAVAIGILAVPTFVWLPREFDSVNTRLASVESLQQAALDSTLAVLDKLNAMEIAIARMDAEPVLNTYFLSMNGRIQLSPVAPPQFRAFTEALPADTLRALIASDNTEIFLYSNFASQNWVFISGSDFSSLDFEVQQSIFESFGRRDVNFNIE